MQILNWFIKDYLNHINYARIIWGQNVSTINRLYTLHKKTLRIINFKESNVHSFSLFHYSKVIKIADKVEIANCLFISKYTNDNSPSNLLIDLYFHQCLTIVKLSFAFKGNLQIHSVQTTSYKKNAFVYIAVGIWNDIQKKKPERCDVEHILIVKLKSLLTEVALQKCSKNMLQIYCRTTMPKYENHAKISCCSNSFKNYLIFTAALSNWSLKIGDWFVIVSSV